MRIRKQYQVIPTNAKLENGDSVSDKNGYVAEYINDHSVVVSSTEPTENARKKVWKQHSKNLFNKNSYISTNLFVGSGGTSYQTASTLKGFIFDVSNYTTLTISKISSQRFGIGASANYPISGGSASFIHDVDYQGTELTVDVTNYNYIVVNYYSTTLDTLTEQQILDTIQIELGTEATEYEDYVDDKEYILNENDVYEEFNPQNEIYSTEEVRIGTWMGKPLYRKILSENTPSATAPYDTTFCDLSNLNIDVLVDFEVMVYATGLTAKLPFAFKGQQFMDCYYNTSQENLHFTSNIATYNNQPAKVRILYTKTTD